VKTVNHIALKCGLFQLIIPAIILCLLAELADAQPLPPGYKGSPTNSPLDSWSFGNPTNWTSDLGYAPVSFTNLAYSALGNGSSLVVDTNLPAWLRYNVVEKDGTTNLTVAVGSVAFWFAPNWSSTNEGGLGPGEWGRLLEVGGYTPNSSYGWWSLYVDAGGNNLCFSAQTNDLSSNVWTYLSVPIAWTTNYFHYIALTYSATNTVLYLDGVPATNGPPVSVYPGPKVLANGFTIGSDSNGVLQAHGLFNTVDTYDYPLATNTVQQIFNWESTIYRINPWNIPYMDNFASAPSLPSTNAVTPDVITGAGYLQWVGAASTCVNGTNAYNVWITNVVATLATNGTMNLMFTIEGGSNGVPFDVFANSVLSFGPNGVPWTWMGQGYQCTTYLLTNLPPPTCFLLLGTPQDSYGADLTDAYQLLVSKTFSNNPYSDPDGLLMGWEILLGLNPNINNVNTASERANYSYTPADWLNEVTGVKSGNINMDPEGNVTQVSQ
jgi:hypothetical protein